MAQSVNITGLTKSVSMGSFEASLQILSPLHLHMQSDLVNAFYNSSEFGKSCVYYHYGLDIGENYPILFDDPTSELLSEMNQPLISKKTRISIPEHLLKREPSSKDKLKINNQYYKILNAECTGAGEYKFNLSKVTHG